MSSFLLLSLYFVFQRFFSVRNLDVLLLLLLSPGLLMVYEGRKMALDEVPQVSSQQLAGTTVRKAQPNTYRKMVTLQTATTVPLSQPDVAAVEAYPPTEPASIVWNASSLQFYGFVMLLAACGLLTIRMLVDPALVRRPLLVPNLSIGGLSFIGVSLFLFLMSIVVTSTPHEQEVRGPQLGPGYAFLNKLPQLPTTPGLEYKPVVPTVSDTDDRSRWLPNLARVLAVLSNLAIVLSIVGIGYWHFDNVKTGIGCAVMYLLLPYTAQMTGNLEHVIPAAMMTLALLAYRQPLLAGGLMGLAAGLVYYPLFLLPLWISFYWKRGLGRWMSGLCSALLLLVGLLLLDGWQEFQVHLSRMFGTWLPRMDGLEGIWAPGNVPADYRLPVLVGFILLSGSFAIWPSRKNLATLMSGTAVIMLAAQFWHGYGGGLYMAWFLPFTLLTVFRPNLDDRIATNVVKAPRSATI
ncbi:MAG: hypothetical protein KF752_17135 [Pirellulaceae bacterium]|nr:hypothetical protein [Pirellulaceae bacterium]